MPLETIIQIDKHSWKEKTYGIIYKILNRLNLMQYFDIQILN